MPKTTRRLLSDRASPKRCKVRASLHLAQPEACLPTLTHELVVGPAAELRQWPEDTQQECLAEEDLSLLLPGVLQSSGAFSTLTRPEDLRIHPTLGLSPRLLDAVDGLPTRPPPSIAIGSSRSTTMLKRTLTTFPSLLEAELPSTAPSKESVERAEPDICKVSSAFDMPDVFKESRTWWADALTSSPCEGQFSRPEIIAQ